MDLIIFSLDNIVQLFSNPYMLSLLGVVGLSAVIAAIKIIAKF